MPNGPSIPTGRVGLIDFVRFEQSRPMTAARLQAEANAAALAAATLQPRVVSGVGLIESDRPAPTVRQLIAEGLRGGRPAG